MTGHLEARRRRERAAAKYRPRNVVLLLVAEAPPGELGRYFYFEQVAEHDDLFREVMRAVLNEEPLRHKAAQLRSLQECGVYLIDLKTDPKIAKEDLSPYVGGLVKRVQEHDAGHVILIKVNVYDLAFHELCAVGAPVVDQRLPFPSSGRQGEFRNGMRAALNAIGWRCS